MRVRYLTSVLSVAVPLFGLSCGKAPSRTANRLSPSRDVHTVTRDEPPAPTTDRVTGLLGVTSWQFSLGVPAPRRSDKQFIWYGLKVRARGKDKVLGWSGSARLSGVRHAPCRMQVEVNALPMDADWSTGDRVKIAIDIQRVGTNERHLVCTSIDNPFKGALMRDPERSRNRCSRLPPPHVGYHAVPDHAHASR